VVVTVAVAVPLGVPEESATGEPLVMEQPGRLDAPEGEEVSEQLSVTEPVYPPEPATVIVEVALLPGEMPDPGLAAETVYAAAVAEVTLTVTVAVCVMVPDVAVTRMP